MAKRTAKKEQTSADHIISAYQDYVLNHGRRPATVYKFCKEIGITESAFYKVAGSFQALEGIIWSKAMSLTLDKVSSDRQFAEFNSREKILAVYFTLLEHLRENRSFLLETAGLKGKPEITPGCMKEFRRLFEEFVAGVLSEGKVSGELASRPYLEKRYPQLFWLHLNLLLRFWADDDSADFERTDAFVEKSVNLAFDLVGKGALDSALDLAKFLYQGKFRS